jgi:hypothetical protein
VQGRGLLVDFRRDRARIGVGIMLSQLGTLELRGRKVWFQLKGKYMETFSTDEKTLTTRPSRKGIAATA